MKCALIVPSWVPEDIFSSKTAGSQINYWQPLGTLYVAAVLRKAGHDVRFFNGAFMPHEELLREVREFSPAFIGIYSTTFGWDRAVKTADSLRGIFGSNAFICAGGPYPIAVQEQCFQRGGKSFDAVVTGEGELTTLAVVDRVKQGEGLDGVLGVVYRSGDNIIKNQSRPLIKDLDSLPFPARDLLGDKNLYMPPPATYRRKPVAVVITSRGCNRKCIYCFQIDKERSTGIRYRSVGNVIAEIEQCVSEGYREIKFIDDTLAADYDRAMSLAKEIKARKFDITWFASACVNQVDRPLLQAFRDAGCWAILFGAESGVQKNLNAIRKGITLDQIRSAVRMAQDVGLTVSTPFLFGIPGETFEEGLETIRFAMDLNPDIANFHAITPFPGTYLYDHIDQYGTMSEELSDYTYQGAAFVPHTMSREDILKLRQIAFRKFYLRPSYVMKRLLSLRSASDLKVTVQGAKSLFWLTVKNNVFERKKSMLSEAKPRGLS